MRPARPRGKPSTPVPTLCTQRTPREAVPEVEVVEVPTEGEIDPSVNGEVLLAMHRSATLPELASRGVRWVHNFGTGVDGFPQEVYAGRTVTCSRGAGAVPISEFVLATMLAFEKDVPDVWLHEPPKHWSWAQLGGLHGRTLGLVGLGGIGTAIAARGRSRSACTSSPPRRSLAPSPLAGVEVVDLAATVGRRPTISSSPRLRPRTHGTCSTRACSRRSSPACTSSTSPRGTLIDQDALRVALDDDRVARASLDVVDPEPLPAGHWLYAHPKVRLSAHISWSSPDLYHRILELFIANLRRYLAGEPLEGVVDPVEGY